MAAGHDSGFPRLYQVLEADLVKPDLIGLRPGYFGSQYKADEIAFEIKVKREDGTSCRGWKLFLPRNGDMLLAINDTTHYHAVLKGKKKDGRYSTAMEVLEDTGDFQENKVKRGEIIKREAERQRQAVLAQAQEQARYQAMVEQQRQAQAAYAAQVAEQQRQAALAQQQARYQAMVVEQQRQVALAQQQARYQAMVAEQQRQAALAQEQARYQAMVAEQQRQARATADEEARRKAAEAAAKKPPVAAKPAPKPPVPAAAARPKLELVMPSGYVFQDAEDGKIELVKVKPGSAAARAIKARAQELEWLCGESLPAVRPCRVFFAHCNIGSEVVECVTAQELTTHLCAVRSGVKTTLQFQKTELALGSGSAGRERLILIDDKFELTEGDLKAVAKPVVSEAPQRKVAPPPPPRRGGAAAAAALVVSAEQDGKQPSGPSEEGGEEAAVMSIKSIAPAVTPRPAPPTIPASTSAAVAAAPASGATGVEAKPKPAVPLRKPPTPTAAALAADPAPDSRVTDGAKAKPAVPPRKSSVVPS